MFNLDKFISDSVTKRPVSMFAADIEANKQTLSKEIKDKTVCVIGVAALIEKAKTTDADYIGYRINDTPSINKQRIPTLNNSIQNAF